MVNKKHSSTLTVKLKKNKHKKMNKGLKTSYAREKWKEKTSYGISSADSNSSSFRGKGEKKKLFFFVCK